MASRAVTNLTNLPKVISRYLLCRPLISASSATIEPPFNLSEKPEPTTASATAPTLDLTDTKALFCSLPTPKLLRTCAILHASAIDPVVDLGMRVMRSKLMDTELTRKIILGAVRHTFYEHFCAGEDAIQIANAVRRLDDVGLRCMLDYASEFATDNEACDRNSQQFLRTVETSKSLPSASVSFVAVKISAICPLQLLERVSDLLRWQYKDPSFNLPWKLGAFPIFSKSSPLYHTPKRPNPLTPGEERHLQLAHQRLLEICQKCEEANVHVCVDAEHTKVQPAIDYLTFSSAIIHRKQGNPLVYTTIQAYLKDARERLLLASEASEKMGIPVGFKLVRGAYMSSERELASSLGFESPIHDSIQETHDCYNDCASFMIQKISGGRGGVVLATHNVESGKLAVAKALDFGVGKVKQRLEFSQLYGMAESLSLGLRNAGFRVSKYMPFGPVGMVMPYLLRRAEENRGLLSASSVDLQLMRKELKRRLNASLVGKAGWF